LYARKKGVTERLNVEDDMRAANQTRERAEVQPGREESMGKTFRGHILLVEDDASLARLEVGFLTAQGYVVTLVENGELALNVLREIVPDLVLLDLDLPGAVNGWGVLKALRADAGTSATPVLLTSAEATAQKHLRTCGEARSTLDHLPKPYSIQTLLKRIDRMLDMTP
jgi:two-component system sensor histidine kinase/response regulator